MASGDLRLSNLGVQKNQQYNAWEWRCETWDSTFLLDFGRWTAENAVDGMIELQFEMNDEEEPSIDDDAEPPPGPNQDMVDFMKEVIARTDVTFAKEIGSSMWNDHPHWLDYLEEEKPSSCAELQDRIRLSSITVHEKCASKELPVRSYWVDFYLAGKEGTGPNGEETVVEFDEEHGSGACYIVEEDGNHKLNAICHSYLVSGLGSLPFGGPEVARERNEEHQKRKRKREDDSAKAD
mmetsp:Transcript_50160/g.76304  ORF Transcript_50160/g.76304 Transcript_50160/m.76304 type:complete len:237 (-) Transcript_50160:11-721(-)